MIVTEGTDTEPAYFGALRDIINGQYRERIQLDICGEGDNTINLFRKAKQNVEESPNGYLIDTIQREVDKFNEHGERAYKLAISVGYAEFGTETIQTVDKLIEAADEQMYQMKEKRHASQENKK